MKKIFAVVALVLSVGSLSQAQRFDQSRDDRGQMGQRDERGDLRGGFDRSDRVNPGPGERGPYGRWSGEEAYLRCNADVRRAVYNGSVRSGYDHYIQYGQYENRIIDGHCEAYDAPSWFNESCYLRNNPDVANAVRKGDIRSGWHHYVIDGRREGRNISCQ